MSTTDVNAGETLAAFARRHGFTRQRAHKLKKRGLPVFDDGSVNSEEADRWLAENLDHGRREAQRQGSDGGGGNARERKEVADAKLKELRVAERNGELVRRVEVDRAVFERSRLERDGWLSWVAQAAPQLAADLDVDEQQAFASLDKLVRERLERLSETTLEVLRDDDNGA